ncbi:MAG: hypothetical protein E7459_04840 [Ruminococcaceae bacterium]|nr:hypothetical protein [Oscillospiraceae bacterium]
MKRNHFTKHALALLLAICMVMHCGIGVGASPAGRDSGATWQEIPASQVSASLTNPAAQTPAEETAPEYTDDELVRVSIVLNAPSAMEKGFTTTGFGTNPQVNAYRTNLEHHQLMISRAISHTVLNGEALDVQWNLTLAANLISANVPYGKLDEIEAVPGVKAVYLERRYELDTGIKSEIAPNNVTAGGMTGTPQVWEAGFTGAGMRIAVIDTGTDTDHQSFDSGAFLYSLYHNGAEAVKNGEFDSVDSYIESLNLLDREELAGYYTQLNSTKRYAGVLTPNALYLNEKLPYAFNYVDLDLDVTHDNDQQTEHGSHVGGIATANSYIPDGQGAYKPALDSVYVVGQAPDAQLITMKVGGKSGGIYDTDYMAAIEDALLLGCDAVNMSFGSSNVGFTYSGNEYFDGIYANLEGTGMVLSNSGGNAYSYAEFSSYGVPYMFADDVNNGRIGSPSSYPNALSVASVDNTGFTGPTSTFMNTIRARVDDAGSVPAGYQVWNTLDKTNGGEGTSYDFIFLGDPRPMLEPGYTGEDLGNYYGVYEDFADLDLTGKIVLVARGNGVAFSDKHQFGAEFGAEAVLVYNNTVGTIGMDITASTATVPCGTVTLDLAKDIFAAANHNEDGTVTGTVLVKSAISMIPGEADADMSMSVFSSWGVPDNLTMKPEITAPGGNIYSVYGSTPDGGGSDQYETMSGTSMAAPQVSGIVALVKQYLEASDLMDKTNLSARTLAQSLLMSTAEPIMETESGLPFSIRRQGAGLANPNNAINAGSYLLMGSDGKIKAEFGDDPQRTGIYDLNFSINNITDADLVYKLESLVMAPGVASDGVNLYMYNAMTQLTPEVSYTVDDNRELQVWYDFDADNDVDNDDAQLLLDYVAGNADAISKEMNADISGNGTVDAYDVHLLMEYVAYGENAPAQPEFITVPAGGSVQVDVTIELSEEDRAYIDESFVNGTYVEGYVYLIPQADAEGKLDVTHSIPMLGFYGSWSEGSMYDRGEWTTDYYNYLAGNPTPHYSAATLSTNYMVTKVDGQQLRYGLNLYTDDEAYLPERASLNAMGKNAISRIVYTLIRNSAETKVVITDDETGEIYYEQSFGQQSSAFYYVNGGAWNNISLTAPINWKGTDASGNALADGTRATISLISASEYYRNADGSIRWDELDDGAVYSMPVLIDNEAPVIHEALQVVDMTTGESALQITMEDNHYVAALTLLNASGSKVLGTVPMNQTTEGGEIVTTMSIDGIIGTEFILAVSDYACNTRYYEVSVKVDSSTGSFYGFNQFTDSWVNFGSDVDRNETVMATASSTFVAGDYAEGHIFAVDQSGRFYAVNMSDMTESFYIKNLYYEYLDLCYDDASATMYGLRNYGNGKCYLYSISLLNASERYVATINANLQSLAATGNGTFYGIDNMGIVYLVEDNQVTEIGALGMPVRGSQATTYSDGKLYWANGGDLLEVSLDDASWRVVGKLSSTTSCLVNTLSTGGSFDDNTRATGIALSHGNMDIFIGNSAKLEATVRPWYVIDRSVSWTSSDESVATVDANGNVTAVGVGSAVITATSNLTPEIFATCTVTVNTLDLKLTAVVNRDDVGMLISNDMTTGERTQTEVKGLSGVVAATYDSVNGALWAADEAGTIHHIDEATGTILQSISSASGLVPSDMEHSQLFGGYFSIYGSWLLIPTPYEENSPGSGFNFTELLAQNTGATSLVSITSMGKTVNQGYDCEMLLCLDNLGNLWQVLPYANGNSYGAFLGLLNCGLAGKIPGTTLNSSIFVPEYGTAGGLMVSLYNGNGTCTVYMIDAANTMNVLTVGTMGENTYPVALYRNVPATEEGEGTDSLPMIGQLNGMTIEARPLSGN